MKPTKQQKDLTKGLINAGIDKETAWKKVLNNSVQLKSGETTVLSSADKKVRDMNLKTQGIKDTKVPWETGGTLLWNFDIGKKSEPIQPSKPLDNKPTIWTMTEGGIEPDKINPTTGEQFNADGTSYQEPSQIDTANTQIEQATGLKDKALQDLRKEKEKAISDTKRGFALWKAKFDENKANYANYDEVNTKYNAVIDEITANMGDNGVVDESVYQSIATKYWLPIEQVKNPNRILDNVQLTEEGKENLGVNKFEQGITDRVTQFERTKEDLENQITRTQQSYNQQMQDATESVQDVITGLTASGAASGLYRSSAMTDSIQRTREWGQKVLQRMQEARNRNIWDIQTSLSRITEDFNQSITTARKEFNDSFKDVTTQNMLALNEAGLNFTGEKLVKALEDINEEFGIQSQQVFSQYMNNLSAINSSVNENMDLVDRIAEQKEQEELKTYNEYLANDWLLLQSTNLEEIIQGVQNGTITPESAQNLRKIMQTSIQSVLGSMAALDMNDIDNINYLLEQGYTPEQTIATMQESFDKFTPAPEVKYREFGGNLYQETAQGLQLVKQWEWTQDWSKLSDGTLFNQKTWEVKTVDGTTTNTAMTNTDEIANFSTTKRGTKNIQCGMLVNDYILKQTGQDPSWDARFEDSLDDKIKAIETMWESPMPVAGGIFVSNPANNTVGHTGIVKSVNPDGSITVLEANLEWSTAGWPPVENTYTAEQVSNMMFSNAVESSEVLWVTGAPLSFERQIKQKVPSTLQNSDGEREQLNQTIKIMADAWYSAEDAALTFMWFDINIKDKDKVNEYINIGRNMWEETPDGFLPTLSNFINAGDYEGADKYVSNIVEDKAKKRYWEDFVPQAIMDNAEKNITEIIRLIDNNRDKLGAVDGRLAKLTKKFKNEPEVQRLNTLMTGTFANLRKNFAGSAVTSTELEALADYIAGDIKEQPDNLITKMSTLLDMQKNQYVNQREQFGYTPQAYTPKQTTTTPNEINEDLNSMDANDLLERYSK